MKKKSIKKRERALEEEDGRENIFFIYFCFFFRSMKIGSQVFIGTEDKVDLRNESYVWTPKSWSFVKLNEVENFPTCVIFSLNAI